MKPHILVVDDEESIRYTFEAFLSEEGYSVSSAADYERIHRRAITRLPGVARIQSSLALRTVKPWTGLPV